MFSTTSATAWSARGSRHVRGVHAPDAASPLPLVLTHGWPSSFVEMLPLVPLLTDPGAHGADPADAFDVVIPSLPGHLFSGAPDGPVTRPKGAASAALRSCVVQQTRLDTARIRAARRVIDPVFLNTPLYRCEALEPGLGCAVSIKLETANPVRSFKARGTELVASLLPDDGPRAVVCASAGNLGQALAWSGRGRGLDITVVASRHATVAKLDRIRALGARLELVDGDHEPARERAAAIARHDGIRLVEDSLDLETCEGAATIGLELVDGLADTVPPFDAVLIALGGGALATGVGHVVKALAPGVEVICVQPLGAPAMTRSWHAGRVVTTDSADTIADGVAGRCPIPAVLDDLLLVADDAVLVRESSIIAGMRMLLDHAGLVVEPAAALGVAAILEDPDRFAGRHVVTIVCGSNVDVDAYHRWVGAAPVHRS
jgi:threonine dehydratase